MWPISLSLAPCWLALAAPTSSQRGWARVRTEPPPHAEAMRLERAFQITRMIVHPERAFDQGRDALEGPALRGKARRQRPLVEELAQFFLLRRGGGPRSGRAASPRAPSW